jgi:hypothetical protein
LLDRNCFRDSGTFLKGNHEIDRKGKEVSSTPTIPGGPYTDIIRWLDVDLGSRIFVDLLAQLALDCRGGSRSLARALCSLSRPKNGSSGGRLALSESSLKVWSRLPTGLMFPCIAASTSLGESDVDRRSKLRLAGGSG